MALGGQRWVAEWPNKIKPEREMLTSVRKVHHVLESRAGERLRND